MVSIKARVGALPRIDKELVEVFFVNSDFLVRSRLGRGCRRR